MKLNELTSAFLHVQGVQLGLSRSTLAAHSCSFKRLDEYLAIRSLSTEDIEDLPTAHLDNCLTWLAAEKPWDFRYLGRRHRSFRELADFHWGLKPTKPWYVRASIRPTSEATALGTSPPIPAGKNLKARLRGKDLEWPESFGPGLTKFQNLIKKFLVYLEKSLGRPRNTRKAYRTSLHLLIEFLWAEGLDITPRNFDKELYTDFLDYCLAERGHSESTLSGHHTALREFFRFLVDEKNYMNNSPMGTVRGTKVVRGLPRPIPTNELDRLLDCMDLEDQREARDNLALELQYGSGLRIGECVGIKIKDLDLEESPTGPSTKIMGKGRIERQVPLTTIAAERAKRWILTNNLTSSDCLFASKKSEVGHLCESALQLRFKRYLKRSGLPEHYTPHQLRHSFATAMLAGGADIRVIQVILGHKSLNTTTIYTKVYSKDVHGTHSRCHPRGANFPPKEEPGTGPDDQFPAPA